MASQPMHQYKAKVHVVEAINHPYINSMINLTQTIAIRKIGSMFTQ